jgi:O-antigen biosynthesis protein
MNYLWDDQHNLFQRLNHGPFAYSDGVEVEDRLYDIVAGAQDRSTFSSELAGSITDWPTEYHLSRFRHGLLRPLGIPAGSKVLELGCGCGAITRYLGEIGADVVAVEGSLPRARVAAERCRDLPNVRVFVDDLLQFETDERFDFVLLIGVLEYAAVFSRQENPFTHYLHSVTGFLASGGRVVVAIENKLGLKYFNGCAEDHLGSRFFGIQDLYGPKTARTFGRRELIAQLSAAGLPHTYFYYPFPDYKLPSVVLSETALVDREFDAVDLLARCHARDYTGSPYRSFDDALAFSALHDNGLVADLSNSFLVVATADQPVQPHPSTFASAFSFNRLREFCAETRLIRRESEIQVVKAKLGQVTNDQLLIVDNLTIRSSAEDSIYRPGRQLLWNVLKARAASANPAPLMQALRPWMDFLLQHASVPSAQVTDASSERMGLASYVLPGAFLDCTPFNLLDQAGELVAIDLEWQSDNDIPLGWVVTRGVLHSLRAGVPLSSHTESLTTIIEALCSGFGFSVSESEVQSWLQMEITFQTALTGLPCERWTTQSTSNGLRTFPYEIFRLSQELASREGQIAALNQTLALRDEHIGNLNQAVRDKDVHIANLDQQLAAIREQQQGERAQAAAQVELLQREIEQLQGELSNVRLQLAMLEGSLSWKATNVFRTALAPYPGLRRSIKRALRLAWWIVSLQLPRRLRARRELLKDRELIANSTWFDAAWYLGHYPDVAAAGWDPALHYALFGATESRNPGPQFDAGWYLDHNTDVKAAGSNPLLQYLEQGASEGRQIHPVREGESAAAKAHWQAPGDYSTWVELYDTITEEDASSIRRHIATLGERPLISIVMPVYNPEPRFLCKAIESVIAQLYQNWELCIADDASPNSEIQTILNQYAREHPRIKVTYRPQRGHISAASNSALDLVTGDFVALMDHDDELPVHALYMVAVELNAHPDADLIYSDEDKIDAEGVRYLPYFKTDWNPELFYSQNMISHLGIYRASLVRQIGRFREGFEGSQDYDLALRIAAMTTPDRIRHIPHVLYHWRRGDDVQTFSSDCLYDAVQAAHRSLADYFASLGQQVEITASRVPYWNRIVRPLPDPPPRVSLIVPTRDKGILLRNCVEGLLHRTRYPNLELIIVDNGSCEPDTLDYLESLRIESRVRILRIDEPFNYAAFNNRAAEKAEGEIIGFINNDIEVITADWLQEMVSQVVQPGVGAVGAKLYYPDDTIQHAGVVLGMEGVAGHAHRGRARSDEGYFGRLQLVHNLSCVTAACMLVPKRVFDEVGGFDEVNLKVAYNDVDLCLKIREAGYSIVWTPYAELYHLESVSRGSDLEHKNAGRARREYAYMRQCWGTLLEHDPFYNPNLSLVDKEVSLAFPPRVRKPWQQVRVYSDSDKGRPQTISDAQREWDRSGRSRLQNLLSGHDRLLFHRSERPTISVVVVLYNKAHLSLLSLEALRRNADLPYELIVVDNASSDDTQHLLERLDGATVLRNLSNVGFGPACMQAVEKARGDYLCFLNNDALLQPTGLTAALDNFIRNPGVGAVGGKILLANGDLQEAGSVIWSDGNALGYGRGDDAKLFKYNFRRPVDFCSGAFLFTPRKLFSELEGFSPRYSPAYYEDADYCMKVWAHGLQVIYEPRAVILHYESASSGNNDAAKALMTVNREKFVATWSDTLRDHHLTPSSENIFRARFAAASRTRSLLYIDDNIPHRHLGAGYPRGNAILHEILRQGYQVTCVSSSSPLANEEYTDIPYEVELFDAVDDGERLGRHSAAADVVWISRPNNMKRYLREVITGRPHRNYKVIYDAEAIFAEREYLECMIAGCRVPPERLKTWVARELAPAKAADVVVCVSTRDAHRMAEAGISSPKVVGHYLETRPTPTPFDKRRDFLFIGRMHGSDDPNTDSMRYFCETVWPRLHDVTGADLVIAGQGTNMFPQPSIPGVRILGAVEDLSKLYDHARVFVVPTRYAAGVPLKLYEAASFGIPAVVSTLIGEQIGWKHEEELLIADTPAEFVDCCSQLYWDEALWIRLRMNSLQRIEADLNLRTFANAVRNVLQTALSEQAADDSR